jgi:RHS repeat-associated protein
VRNQLASISGGNTASFQYDPFARRTSKTVGGVGTQFLYDRANPVQELSGSTPIANLLTGLAVDEIFTRADAAEARHFLTDVLGSTMGLRDSSGNLLTQYTYEPFGNTTVTGSAFNPYQYTGRENDGTSLYFYRARYYNPALERFIKRDLPPVFGPGLPSRF